MVIPWEVKETDLLEDSSFWHHECENGWAGMSCNNTNSDDQATTTNANVTSGHGISRTMGELLGVLLTTVAFITSESAWRKRGTITKADTSSAGAQDAQKQSQKVDEQEQEADIVAGPSQAEMDWVTAARSGKVRLTEDVYKAAMQWWLDQPLADVVDKTSPEDQRILKPVIELMRRGQDEKASMLIEQVGRLDRMERDLQRSRSKVLSNSSSVSPLSRRPSSPGISAGVLRNAIESSVLPLAQDISPKDKQRYWHTSWKRPAMALGEHVVASASAIRHEPQFFM
jgi:hypothetical protein